MIAAVKYQLATYTGIINVCCDENEDDEIIINRAKHLLRNRSGGSLPFGYSSFKVINRG